MPDLQAGPGHNQPTLDDLAALFEQRKAQIDTYKQALDELTEEILARDDVRQAIGERTEGTVYIGPFKLGLGETRSLDEKYLNGVREQVNPMLWPFKDKLVEDRKKTRELEEGTDDDRKSLWALLEPGFTTKPRKTSVSVVKPKE